MGKVDKQMKYGQNTSLVLEVIKFISNNKLFESNSHFPKDVTIVDDYERAKQLAFSQDLKLVDVTWQDVKSNESAALFSSIYKEENLKETDNELSEIFESSDNYNEDFIPFDYWDISEEIESDLYKIALNRFINGNKTNFYEEMFECYQSGGWPCGWEGIYPNGKFIVYVPSSDHYSKE
ncbi:cytoplasmic protein [Paenibacillus tundrae]|nr:cytoplasmic protein [Paenibacillus tundrae]